MLKWSKILPALFQLAAVLGLVLAGIAAVKWN